jgi:glycosyltransferase involved in cell wall biosynthesis
LKILIFSQHFNPENFRVNDVAKALCLDHQYQVSVVTGKPNYPSGKLFPGYKFLKIKDNWSGIEVNRVPIWLRRDGGIFNLSLNYLTYIVSATFYSCLKLSKLNPDVVFCYATSPLLQAIPAILYSKIFKKKIIINVQDLWPESLSATGKINNRFIIYIVDKFVKWIYENSDLILAQSNAFIERIGRYTNVDKVKYWPNSVDDIFLYPSNKDSNLPSRLIEENIFKVMFAGNIGSAQSVDTIFKVALNLKPYSQIKFFIVGDGSSKLYLENMVHKFALNNIVMLGQFPIAEMPSLLNRADVLLITLANKDIFSLTIPNKLQAYMAIGKPILGAINGEASKLILQSQSGICVPADDSLGLSKGVLEMYQLPKENLDQMGRNGQNYFRKNFLHKNLVIRLDKYINDLIKFK